MNDKSLLLSLLVVHVAQYIFVGDPYSLLSFPIVSLAL